MSKKKCEKNCLKNGQGVNNTSNQLVKIFFFLIKQRHGFIFYSNSLNYLKPAFL